MGPTEHHYLQCGRPRFNPRVGKIPWRRKWQPTPEFLLGEFHGQKRLTGYSPWGHKEYHVTEQLTHTNAKVGRWGKQSSLGVSDSLGIPAFSWPEGPRASLHPVGFSGLCQAPKAPLGRQGSRHSSENPTFQPPPGHFLVVLPLGWCPLLSGHCLPLEEEDKVMLVPKVEGTGQGHAGSS